MTGFKGIRWIRNAFAKRQDAAAKNEAVHTPSLSGTESGPKQAKSLLTLLQERKWPILHTVSTLGLTAVMLVAGHQFVRANMVEVYHVMVDGKDIGIIDDKKIVEQFEQQKAEQLSKQYPNVHMELPTDRIVFGSESAFMNPADNSAVLAKLSEVLKPQAVGVELRIDGKLIGVVKDKETANRVLDQIKAPYLPKENGTAQVSALSDDISKQADSKTQLDKVEFVQSLQLEQIPVQPNDIMKPEDLLKKLQTGDTQPTTYIVQKGDCVSCVAKKFGISKQLIYQKNPWINDDVIKAGDKLDLTVLKPPLSVKTEETMVDQQEVQYNTEYVTDDSLRAGVIQPISPGKNGLKKVTLHLVKIDGLLASETVTGEEMIVPPVTAKAKKGTKVVLGEGSGKFAWPVLGPTVTSPFGMRWGKLHKGIDISGNSSILSADNGRVEETGYKDDYGNYVIIDHQNGYETLYAHLSKIMTSRGQIVEKGEKIGIMGETGDATGVHLHFEIHQNGGLQNPLKFLNQ